jgi:hypothetical protein
MPISVVVGDQYSRAWDRSDSWAPWTRMAESAAQLYWNPDKRRK